MAGQSSNRVTFSVGGMGCGGCAAGLQARLLSTPGVERTQVDFAAGLAEIEFDAAVSDPRKLGEVISTAGYTATEHAA